MFTVSYPTIAERQAYEVRALRLRGAVVASLARTVARWMATAAR